jgi:hypothetical protein
VKKSYRVTKYHCYNGEGKLYSPDSEWTSYFDVGSKVSIEEYLLVEGRYVSFILELCERLGVQQLKVNGLEVSEDCKYKEGQSVDVTDVVSLVEGVLRETFWCKLVSDEVEFHFGYDFYMYAVCSLELADVKNVASSLLNVESFESPYL